MSFINFAWESWIWVQSWVQSWHDYFRRTRSALVHIAQIDLFCLFWCGLIFFLLRAAYRPTDNTCHRSLRRSFPPKLADLTASSINVLVKQLRRTAGAAGRRVGLRVRRSGLKTEERPRLLELSEGSRRSWTMQMSFVLAPEQWTICM